MPYQDHHISDTSLQNADPGSGEPAQGTPSNARSIQITVLIGLVLAVIVAVFGRF